METNEKELSPQESLQLIQTMINKTKDAVADDSFYFLFWGWLVFICCITSFTMKVYFHSPYFSFVWFLMPVGGIISGVYGSRKSKKEKVKTFVREALNYLWMALGIALAILISINFLVADSWQTAFTYFILLYGIGTFVSGKLIKFQPLVVGGIINFALAAISVKFSYDYQLLIGGLAILISYIIPGHLLRLRHHQNK